MYIQVHIRSQITKKKGIHNLFHLSHPHFAWRHFETKESNTFLFSLQKKKKKKGHTILKHHFVTRKVKRMPPQPAGQLSGHQEQVHPRDKERRRRRRRRRPRRVLVGALHRVDPVVLHAFLVSGHAGVRVGVDGDGCPEGGLGRGGGGRRRAALLKYMHARKTISR